MRRLASYFFTGLNAKSYAEAGSERRAAKSRSLAMLGMTIIEGWRALVFAGEAEGFGLCFAFVEIRPFLGEVLAVGNGKGEADHAAFVGGF